MRNPHFVSKNFHYPFKKTFGPRKITTVTDLHFLCRLYDLMNDGPCERKRVPNADTGEIYSTERLNTATRQTRSTHSLKLAVSSSPGEPSSTRRWGSAATAVCGITLPPLSLVAGERQHRWPYPEHGFSLAHGCIFGLRRPFAGTARPFAPDAPCSCAESVRLRRAWSPG